MKIQNTLYCEDTNSLECLHCLDVIELRKATAADPELLLQVREEYELDHSKCNQYKDIRKANAAREYRTEGQRRKLLERQSSGPRPVAETIH